MHENEVLPINTQLKFVEYWYKYKFKKFCLLIPNFQISKYQYKYKFKMKYGLSTQNFEICEYLYKYKLKMKFRLSVPNFQIFEYQYEYKFKTNFCLSIKLWNLWIPVRVQIHSQEYHYRQVFQSVSTSTYSPQVWFVQQGIYTYYCIDIRLWRRPGSVPRHLWCLGKAAAFLAAVVYDNSAHTKYSNWSHNS